MLFPSTLIWKRGDPPPQLAAVNLKSVARFVIPLRVRPAGIAKLIPPDVCPVTLERSWSAVFELLPGVISVASPNRSYPHYIPTG